MTRSFPLVLVLAVALVALVSSRAIAQSLPSPNAEPASEEGSTVVVTASAADSFDLSLPRGDAGGVDLSAQPRGIGAPQLLLAVHAAAPGGAMDPFAMDMALAGPNVPASSSAPTLTFAATTAALAQAPPPPPDPYWGYENQHWGGAGGVSFYEFTDAEFRLAAEREEWDSVDRFEFAMYSREPLHGHVEAMIGGFIFWEERDWEEGASKVLYDTWGFGVDMGAMIYPFPNADQKKLNLGVLPYFRLAMGFGDGDFRNIEVDLPIGTGLASGDVGDLRFDIGVGVEARAVIARTFFAGIGVGYNWWTTADGAAGTTSNGGVVVVVDDEFDFGGDEAYIRASAGFFF